jgi:hypothetical protein
MTWRVRATMLALAVVAARPADAQLSASRAPVTAARQVTLRFDERGALDPSSAPDHASLAALAAGSTDVFVLSHGWRNDEASADCRYQQQIQGITVELPASARPLFIKIMWPSAMYPVIHDGCGAPPNRPYFADQQERAPSSEVRQWARAAFPAAARARRFDGEVERLTALLNAGVDAPAAASPRTREAAAILIRWRDDADGAIAERSSAIDGPGERAPARTADDVVAAYEAIQHARPQRAPWSVVPSIAEVFSFWTMKARAGVVGSAGVHDVLRELAASMPSSTRLHLVGHSFGGKLLAAALVGRPGAQPVSAESLTILQGALSHFAFSTAAQIRALDVATEIGGAYAEVLTKKLAAVVAVTYSQQDRDNQRWYPLGTLLSQDAFEKGVPVYAALGARGLEGAPSVAVALREESVAARYSPARPRIFNIDASGVVMGHSDVTQPRVYRIVADVVAVANRARIAESQKK